MKSAFFTRISYLAFGICLQSQRHFPLAPELARVQVVVVAAGADQFGVRAHLGDLARLDDQDAAGAAERTCSGDGRKGLSGAGCDGREGVSALGSASAAVLQ